MKRRTFLLLGSASAGTLGGLVVGWSVLPPRQRLNGHHPLAIQNGEIALIVNTVEEKRVAVRDSYVIRRAALQGRVPLFTTLDGARAACTGMEHVEELRAYVIQDLHAKLLETA